MTGGTSKTAARAGVGVLLALGIASNAVGQGFSRFSYPLLLPDIYDDLLPSYGVAGGLATLNLAAYLAGVLLVSVLSERVRSTRIIGVGLALCGAGVVTLAVARDVGQLAAGMALTGAGAAGTWVPVAAVVSAAIDDRRRATAMGALTAGFGGGVLLAGALRWAVYGVAGAGSWRLVWIAEGVLIAAVLAAFLLWFRPSFEPASEHAGNPLRALRSVPGWAGLTAAYTALGLGYIIYASFLTSMLENDAGFSPGHAATVFSLIGITSILGALLMGHVADRFGQRRTYTAGAAILGACALVALLHAEPWNALSAAVFGLLLTGTGAIVPAYIGDHLSGAAMSAGFAVVTVAFGVAQAAGPWLGGAVSDATGSFTVTFLIAAAALVASAVAAAMLPRGARPIPS